MINLSDIVTVDQVPLTADDLDTAIEIANGSEVVFEPVARRRTIKLNNLTFHRTSAGPFEEYIVDSALKYLAARPAAPTAEPN